MPEYIPIPGQGGNRIALARIDSLVSAKLGPARVRGNAQPAAFNRQVAMYLAHRVGGWSTTRIGRFYNGRDHSTVCHAIKRIQALRNCNAEIEGLLSSLIQELRNGDLPEGNPSSARLSRAQDMIWTNDILDDLAERIASRLRSRNCG